MALVGITGTNVLVFHHLVQSLKLIWRWSTSKFDNLLVSSSDYRAMGCSGLNTLKPRQNRRHFTDGIFKCIFFNENVWILIQIFLKFVPKCPIKTIPALVQIMAWHQLGNKPSSEPMRHICVTQPQWVKKVRRYENFTPSNVPQVACLIAHDRYGYRKIGKQTKD